MIGRLWSIDAQGYIRNDARSDAVQPPYDAAVHEAAQTYVEGFGPDLDSIYVTGSVSRGLAVPGDSDLNMIAVLGAEVDMALVRQQWIEAAEANLSARHPVLRAVDLDFWPYYYVFDDPERFSIGAFILKTHSLCVWGGDLSPVLPDFRVTPAIANEDLVNLAVDLDDALDDLDADGSAANVVYWNRRIAKALLHCGFGLVQMAEGQHTRDVDLCYSYFVRHYPQHAGTIQIALDYARHPLDDYTALMRYLDSLDWMTALADAWLDQHNPNRDLALLVDDVEA